MPVIPSRVLDGCRVANEVYTQTHDGLATLVSARAAQRVLDRALHKTGQTADTVSGRHMKRLLLGPVFRELETTLPRDGLRRTLKKLASEVNRVRPAAEPSASPDPADVGESYVDAAGEAGDFEVDAPRSYGASAAAQGEADEVQNDASGEFVPVAAAISVYPVSEHPVSEAPRASAQTPPTPAPVAASLATAAPTAEPAKPSPKFDTLPPLSGAQLEAAVLRFAGLEEVKLVAAFGPKGEPSHARGGGFDLDALARFGLMTLTLLRRSGRVRAYYLAHSLHQLFLLPLGGSTLIVVGTPELNVGSVFGALSTLEEER